MFDIYIGNSIFQLEIFTTYCLIGVHKASAGSGFRTLSERGKEVAAGLPRLISSEVQLGN